MVECILGLNTVFGSLADATRRDILERVAHEELSVSEIAQPYDLTLAAVSKHLVVLEKANMIRKRRQGKQQLVRLRVNTLHSAIQWMQGTEAIWKAAFDRLERALEEVD